MESNTLKEKSSQDNIGNMTNQHPDNKSFEHVKSYSHKGKGQISQRLEEIENEWDIERMIHLHVSGISITGALLGMFVNKKWFVLPAIAAAVLLLHSLKGVAPQKRLLRKMGFRTRNEINREKYSLKAMRGDFKNTDSADAVWEASE